MDKRIRKLLFRSLDAPLKGKEEARLRSALAGSAELRRLEAELRAIRLALAEAPVRSFRPGFAGRAIERYRSAGPAAGRSESFAEAYAAVFKRFAIAGLIVLAVLVSYNLAKGGLLPRDAIFYASNLAVGKLLSVPIF